MARRRSADRPSADREADVVVVGAGLAGLAAARAVGGRGQRGRARGARPGRRAHAEPRLGGRQGRRGRRAVGRSDAAPHAGARARARGRDVPDLRRGRERVEWRGELVRYAARSRASTRPSWPTSPRRMARLDRHGAAGARSRRRGARQGAPSGTARRSPPGCGATLHAGGAEALFELVSRRVWAHEPADLSLLHVLFYIHSGGRVRHADLDTDGGAQQHRFVGGSQLIALARWPSALGDRIVLDAPGAADRRRRRRRDASHADGVEVRGRARDRRDPADAGRADRLRARRCRAAATSSPSACRRAR